MLLCEDERLNIGRFCSLFQKFPAQQWKLLNADSERWDEGQIDLDGVRDPLGGGSSLKRVGANTRFLRKPGEMVFDLRYRFSFPG